MEKLLDVDISTGIPIIIAMLTLILVFSQSNQTLLSLEVQFLEFLEERMNPIILVQD